MSWITIFALLLLVILAALIVSRSRTVMEKYTGGGRRGRDIIKDLTTHPRSRSESAVIKYLEDATGLKFPTINPAWLMWRGRTLELDGYNASANIALEFSGPLHTKWFPARESYAEYFERVVRDVVKRKMCKKHGVTLIVVDASLPSRHWQSYVLSRLYDIGKVQMAPIPYVPEQKAKPFRNEQLEKELGLTADMVAAKSL